MKRIVIILAAATLMSGTARAQGDTSVASVQQKLKDQGFYYGEVTGRKDADTSAAIRRYQIRNGLQITGELNAETRKSLGVKGGATTAPAPMPSVQQPAAPQPTRRVPPRQPVPRPQAPDELADLRDDSSAADEAPVGDDEGYRARSPAGFAPGPRGLAPALSGVFDGTPFEVAPPDVQRRVIVGAQTLLMRQGYYRSGIDGVFGPGMEFALRAYQSGAGLEPNGRLDLETLGSLGLLPGQQTRRYERPRRRFWPRAPLVDPRGERIYIPR